MNRWRASANRRVTQSGCSPVRSRVRHTRRRRADGRAGAIHVVEEVAVGARVELPIHASRIVTRVAVTVRTATFYTRTKIRKLDAPTTDADVIVAAALRVLDLFELDRPVRLLGVRLELQMPQEPPNR